MAATMNVSVAISEDKKIGTIRIKDSNDKFIDLDMDHSMLSSLMVKLGLLLEDLEVTDYEPLAMPKEAIHYTEHDDILAYIEKHAN